jgi:hypothetical protein
VIRSWWWRPGWNPGTAEAGAELASPDPRGRV